MNQIAKDWIDYEVLDTGNREKLERWNDVILRRPDPVAIWPIENDTQWNKADAFYHRSNQGGGHWEYKKPLKEFWTIQYKDLRFKISPTGFKHTGLFPEQASNWDFMMKTIAQAKAEGKKDIKILNLFAYTGGATMACSKAGAEEVVHVDASKGINEWAKENMRLNHLEDHKIRFIVDDVMKFIQREIRRGRKYDGIVMDPPSYGRGPKNEVWKLENSLYELVHEASKLLSDDPLFLIVNCYTTGFSLCTLDEVMKRAIIQPGTIEVGENLLPVTNQNGILPCGIFGRWTPKKIKNA
ncbi:class I SAM-dependent methyltransferase [Dubosiella newyorkensis]|jgi:23S rRNA (cytosine1962-C5)-methyltransferase|uniref:SAM-dependent methyltransferase n=2 Tax=Dubosiella newyorkensis TaxID=1862672 RepID=A0A1U7NKC3_9FIRM|nr:class I SAM-dependent methyltransferase [Dubosiella newyorkensis]MCI9042102.1 SAM-dependent methyltransferase [Dubosiella newyorkensis]OLU44613.1 SAM-dependent methyltransferase [Dubosiella newyorkensis]